MGYISDFHSHILPNMDDGSSSVEESVALLELEAAQGVDRVLLTPHFYPLNESPRDFLERRNASVKMLLDAIEGRTDLPHLTVGAEVAYYLGMSQSEELPLLAIEGTDCILIEMPPAPWPKYVWRDLRAIREEWGLMPIIAHVDRYIRPLRTYGIPRRLEEIGVLVQANGNFFIRRETERMAMKLLKTGRVHLIGSDCHGLETRRPNVKDAVEKIERKLGREALFRIGELEEKIFNRMDWNGVIE